MSDRSSPQPGHASPLWVRVLRYLWIAGFAIGTTTHVLDIVLGGAEVYDGFPTVVKVFWLSLTIVDPVVIILLVVAPRSGIVLALAVILVDIAVNWMVFTTIGGLSLFGVMCQTSFAVLLVVTADRLWKAFSDPSRGRRRPG